MADKKPKRAIPRRADAGESRFQLPEREPRERDASFVGELIEAANQQENKITPSRPSTPSRGSTRESSVAPMRDFAKVANSIVRDVVPTGLFTGKSKQLYDYLYSLTRGAIQPSRSVSLTKVRLMVGAGIGSEVTLRANLAKLKTLGLIDEDVIPGTHGGNQYTIYLPEEAQGRGSTPSRASSTSQNLDPVPPLDPTPSRASLIVDSVASSGDSKTLIKTKEENSDDDAGARRLVAKLIEAERELTGKVSTGGERWEELAELLIAELRIAAARTTVSNVPAFLTEHLRRRLWKVDKACVTELSAVEEGSQSGVLTAEQRRKCPDCGGMGFWYPEGPDKGVAKCKHLRIESVLTSNKST